MLKSILLAACLSQPLLADKIPVYLGTGSDKGIFMVSLDTESGALSELRNVVQTDSPSSLAISKDQNYLFATGRKKGEKSGFVASFAIQDDHTLKAINKQSSLGAGPCHISLDNSSRSLFVANYSGGSVTSYSLRNVGHVMSISDPVTHHQLEGSSVNPKRQTKPHAHSIYSSPDNKFVYAADLGTDQVRIYKLDSETSKLVPVGVGKVPAGGGPRHMAFSRNGAKLYVLNELTVTISQFARNIATGALKLEKTKPVMNLTGEGLKSMSGSEIQLSGDGAFIYVACRDLENRKRDAIAVLKTDTLDILQNHPTGVWIPRHFGISPSGKWLLIAGQKANQVIVHGRDIKTGLLTKTKHSIELDRPMWILFPKNTMHQQKNTMKIMSYNIRYASGGIWVKRHWKNRLPIMAEEIIKPSIVGFQEVLSSQLADLKHTMQQYSHVGVGREDGKESGEHVPIFFQKDQWEKKQSGNFWLSDTPEKPGSKSWGNRIPRMCTWVSLVDKKNGRGIYVYNAHLDHLSWRSRKRSAEFLLEKIKNRESKEYPAVLLGDLNCKPTSPAMKVLLADSSVLIDSFTVNPYDLGQSSTFNSWKISKKGSRRIDYILTTPTLQVLDSEIMTYHKNKAVASDHNAIVTTVKWSE